MPSAPRWAGSGASNGSSLVTPVPSEHANSWTPNPPYTCSPTANPGCTEAVTRPTAPASITAPIATGSR